VERKNVLFRVKKRSGYCPGGGNLRRGICPMSGSLRMEYRPNPNLFSWGSVRGLFTGRVIRTSSTTEYLTMILYRPTTQTRCMTMILRHRVTSGDVLALFDAPTATSV